jgi:hypothetical protein
MDLFEDEDWADETLDWWTEYVIVSSPKHIVLLTMVNRQVFGDDPKMQDTVDPNYETGVASVAAQRAARQAAAREAEEAAREAEKAAQEAEAAGEEPEVAGKGFEEGDEESETGDEESEEGDEET